MIRIIKDTFYLYFAYIELEKHCQGFKMPLIECFKMALIAYKE